MPTWSWSHTPEAYEYAETKMRELPHRVLAEILAEWHARALSGNFSQPVYDKRYTEFMETDKIALEDAIWERAARQRDGTVGGYKAFMCPFGCTPHSVPFGPEEEEPEF